MEGVCLRQEWEGRKAVFMSRPDKTCIPRKKDPLPRMTGAPRLWETGPIPQGAISRKRRTERIGAWRGGKIIVNESRCSVVF